MRYHVIYMLSWVASGSFYVGSAGDLNKRKSNHLTDLRRGCHANIRLQRLWNKLGEAGFEVSVLEEATSETLIEREQVWIDHCLENYPGQLINFCTTAGSRRGVKSRPWNEEDRARMRAVHLGSVRSDETRARMSEAQAGRSFSEDTKRKMSEAAKARWRRGEERARLVEAAKHRSVARSRDELGQWS